MSCELDDPISPDEWTAMRRIVAALALEGINAWVEGGGAAGPWVVTFDQHGQRYWGATQIDGNFDVDWYCSGNRDGEPWEGGDLEAGELPQEASPRVIAQAIAAAIRRAEAEG